MEGLYEVKIQAGFAAAHQLRNFRGKCENLHGHNWKVEVVVRGTRLDECGILVDFGELKKATNELLEELDHKLLNDHPCFRDVNPSSEHIARFIFQRLSQKFNGKYRWVHCVSTWESDNACATYYGIRSAGDE
ncbi:6-carboxytetrahydropterin synthase QueD [Thermodesulforhabdus norvegica]|uniref:6-carboxy-5,6,7,8-tetrahydropterin synthase n=1 Tax=Thermodesulforhabdus norvegica TaxID=39841 RepID=A0A1I4QSH7_9BACT|nr:6-carboxytetrahydropterin synthase QueD [Thermodesulforhabdus norvegica]SFM42656.1 preQ(0) biosynthesis protein QueD [Thermodesulforhabdus norvegica]